MNELPRVMCLDDIPEVCETVRSHLVRLPARVDAFLDGESVIERILKPNYVDDPYKIMVLDLKVPRRVGQLWHKEDNTLGLRVLQGHRLIAETKVVIFTAYPTIDNCVKSIRAGAHDFVGKQDPVTLENGLPRLMQICRDLLYPKPDPIEQWFKRNLSRLVDEFGGSVVAVFDVEPKPLHRLSGQDVDGRLVIAAADQMTLDMEILRDERFRWQLPSIFNIPRFLSEAS